MEHLPFQYQKRKYWAFYCPICKIERRSTYWPSPRLHHYLKLLGLTVFITGMLWAWAGIKGVFLVIPIWAIFEFVYRSKARQSLICPHCGFDPYLYKYDVKLARQKVEKFFADKKKGKDGEPGAADEQKPEPAKPTGTSKS